MSVQKLGIVIIGRNEGDRLEKCLCSVGAAAAVVYVDSGSTDQSVSVAGDLGAVVVQLDLSRPFTAARARNAGFTSLRQIKPDVAFVQFVDGDCEIRDGWLSAGIAALISQPRTAVICGRLRERYPERSIYNRMCDIGWDYPIGEIASCGGVAMYRAESYAAVGGFDEELIAGEEFELCSRLRRAGGCIVRIDMEMAWHDVGITRFAQWWRRAVRSGFGAAEGWFLYDAVTGAEHRRRLLRAVAWGGVLPLAAFIGLASSLIVRWGVLVPAFAVAMLCLNWARLCIRERTCGRPWSTACWLSTFSLISKTAELRGVIEYFRRHMSGSAKRIIEYRSPS